jgi:hypothetical protein
VKHDDPFEPMSPGPPMEALTDEGVAVIRFKDSEGRPRILFGVPAAARGNVEQMEVLADLQGDVGLIMTYQRQLADRVRLARELGMSWHTIGWSVGLTGEGARKRWGDGSTGE